MNKTKIILISLAAVAVIATAAVTVFRPRATFGGQIINTGNLSVPSGTISDSTGNSTQWSEAYSWGNHAVAGYINASSDIKWSTTSADYWETTQAARGGAGGGFTTTSADYWLGTKTTASLTENTNLYYTDGRVASYVNGSTTIQSRLNNGQTAFSWGNHASAGYITDGNTGWDNSYGFIDSSALSPYLLSATAASTYLTLSASTSLNYSSTTHNHYLSGLLEKSYNSLTDTPDLSTYFTLSSWYATTSKPNLVITKSQVSDFGSPIYVETDPIWTAASTSYLTVASSTATYMKFTTSFGGDVSGTYNSIAVTDNSHAHDGTTISGLAVADFTSPNISNWTNNAGYITSTTNSRLDFLTGVSSTAVTTTNLCLGGVCNTAWPTAGGNPFDQWLGSTTSVAFLGVSTTNATTTNFSLNGAISGALAFFNSAKQMIVNSLLFWDNTNNRLGVGTSTPATTLDVYGTSTMMGLIVDNSVNTTSTVQIGDVGRVGCIKMRDSDDGGYSYCKILDGTLSCSITSCE